MTSLEKRMLNKEARTLTDRIKRGAEEIWRLLEKVHDEKGYLSLGYKSWEAYLREEFEYSQNYGNKLIAHARFHREIESKTGTTVPDLSEWETRGLDPLEVSDAVAERVRAHPEQVEQIVKEEIAKARGAQELRKAVAEMNASASPGFNAAQDEERMVTRQQLYEAVKLVLEMPPPEEVIAIIPPYQEASLEHLNNAVLWLLDFNNLWERRINESSQATG